MSNDQGTQLHIGKIADMDRDRSRGAWHRAADCARCLAGRLRAWLGPRPGWPYVKRIISSPEILFRLIYGFLCSWSYMLGRYKPGSTSYMIKHDPTGYGYIIVTLLGISAITIWADVIINDILPPRFQLKWTSKHRAKVFGLPAGCYLAIVFVIYADHGDVPSMYSTIYGFCGFAVFAMLYVAHDWLRRSVRARCDI